MEKKMLQVQNTTTSELNPNLLSDEGQEPTTRTSELTDQVANTPKKALTSRRAYTTLKTVGNLLSKLADATKPILTKICIFR